jgi:hypothetical protein
MPMAAATTAVEIAASIQMFRCTVRSPPPASGLASKRTSLPTRTIPLARRCSKSGSRRLTLTSQHPWRGSSIARELAASPVMVFPCGIEHRLDMAVQGPHDADPR